MKNIEVYFKSEERPHVFGEVEEFYEHWKTIEIIQHQLYKTTKIIINKSELKYYKVIDLV